MGRHSPCVLLAQGNLQAATQSTLQLRAPTEISTPVTNVMIREADFVTYDVAAGNDINAVMLADLYA